MTRNEIEDILELYGYERILEDHNMTMTDVFDILVDSLFLDLEQYQHED